MPNLTNRKNSYMVFLYSSRNKKERGIFVHHTLFEYIYAFGVSVLSYMIARLLHYAVLKCEDADTHPRLRTVLCWVMCLFYFLGIIVTLLLGLIENLHRRRISKLHEADIRELRRRYAVVKKEIRSILANPDPRETVLSEVNQAMDRMSFDFPLEDDERDIGPLADIENRYI